MLSANEAGRMPSPFISAESGRELGGRARRVGSAPERRPPPGAAGARTAEDTELVRRVAARDGAALRALHQRYAPACHSVAMNVVGDHGAAEEVVQDVFLRLWRFAAAFDAERGSLGTWLMTITQRCGVDELRRRRRYVGVLADGSTRLVALEHEDSPWGADEGAGPCDALIGHEDSDELRWALGRLAPHQRDAIRLAYYGCLTHKEIAGVVGAPLGTIKSRVRSGLLRLRRLLSDGPASARNRGGAPTIS